MFPPLTPIEKILMAFIVFILLCVFLFAWLTSCDTHNPTSSVSMDMTEDTPLADTLSGTLEPGVYYVTGNVVIPQDSVLVARDCYFLIENEVDWDVCGLFQAYGCRFDVADLNHRWSGLIFHPDPSGQDEIGNYLQDCHIYRGGYREGKNGGGISAVQCKLTLRNVTVAFCEAEYGGGIYCQDMEVLRIDGCKIWANGAEQNGGGIYLYGCDGATIDSCQIGKNYTMIGQNNQKGGGIFIERCNGATISRCVVYDNYAEERGAGVFNFLSPNLSIVNCTIADNTTNSSGWRGAGLFVYFVQSHTTVVNTILWNNTRWGGQIEDVHGDAYITYSDVSEGAEGVGNISADPLFADQYYHIEFESPCRDAGDSNSSSDPDSSRADMGVHYYHQD